MYSMTMQCLQGAEGSTGYQLMKESLSIRRYRNSIQLVIGSDELVHKAPFRWFLMQQLHYHNLDLKRETLVRKKKERSET